MYLPYFLRNKGVITSASTEVIFTERKETILSSQQTSSITENDLKLEWLLCLASALEASRRQQIRAQAEKSIAIRTKAIKTKHNPYFERLLFLTSKLQTSHQLQGLRVG
jgi:hypothetical protein